MPVEPFGYVGDMILTMGSTSGITSSTTTYLGPVGHQSTAVNAVCAINEGGTVRNLEVVLSAAPSAGQTVIATVFHNGVATLMTCTVSGTATAASDTLPQHGFQVVRGDTLQVQVVYSSGATTSYAFATVSVLG